MAKIAIDARQLKGTGAGRYLDRLIYYLQQIDNDNDYIILLKPEDIDSWQISNSNFTKIACPHKEFTFDEQIGLRKQLNKLKPDLVHFGMVQQPIFYSGPHVTTMHDLTTARFRNQDKNSIIFYLKQRVYIFVNKRVAKKSNHIITPTQFVRKDIAKFTGINLDKITVTYEAADPITAPIENLPSVVNRDFIMFVGRPNAHKNLEQLINAYVKIKEQYPKLYLVLVGKTNLNYKRIALDVANRKIDKVIFTDYISDGQLRWLYEHCSAYIFPSLSEGFGLPGLEAMLHGAPVVSSNATCLPEVYGLAAHYFNPLDIDDMANKIKEVLANRTLRQNLIKAGYKQVARYSWKLMAEETLKIYRKALEERSE